MKTRRLLACLILPGLAWLPQRAAAGPEQDGAPPGGKGVSADLIADLGSESWTRREDAQEKILREGIRVAPLLEEALSSENVELAHRARYLLARIDPQITRFQVFKIDTRARTVVEVASVSGTAGQALTARSGDAAGPSFSIEFRAMEEPPDRIEVLITQSSPGPSGMEVRREARSPADVILVKRSEECLYRRLGLEIERERHPSITVARVRTGRRSLLEARPPASTPRAARHELIADLREQASASGGGSRATAIDILGELGEAGDLDGALADPDTRAVAAVALGDPELLAETMLAAGERPLDPALGALGIRAAAKLLEAGDERALDFLIERLEEGDAAGSHLVMAALADRAARRPLPAEARVRLLEAGFSEDFLGRAPWEDVETEYFLSTLAGLLRPDAPADAGMARAALERIEGLARGELGPMPVRLRSAIDLWQRVARRLPDGAGTDTAMVLRVLPALTNAASASEALRFLEESVAGAGSPLETAGDLPLLLESLVSSIEGGDPGIATAAFQSLLRISQALPASRGELRPLLLALIRACEATARAPDAEEGSRTRAARPAAISASHVRQAEEILAARTGFRPTPPGRSPGQPPTARRDFDAAAWKAWLEDEARVAAREEEIIGAGGHADAGDPPIDLVYHEFDLLLHASDGVGEGPAFDLLDGRRIEVTTGRPVAYEDRWGNRIRLRIDRDGVQRGPDRPTRFRLNARPSLFAGLPVLGSIQGRTLGATWYETSEGFFGSVPVQGQGAPAYRTLSYLAYRDAAPPPPAGVQSPEELWRWFLERHLLSLPDDAPPHAVNAVVGITRTLKIKECAPLLRKLFDRAPTPDLARHLHELGDPGGVEWLRREVETGREDAKLRAAIILCELGLDDGARALIAGSPAKRPLVRRMHYQVTAALDAYLKSPGALREVREEVLDFLFGALDDAVFQPRAFIIIQREAGTDFGFSSARGMDDQEKRREAIEEAVRSARQWRAAHGGKRF